MIVRIFELFGILSVRVSVDFPELQEFRAIPGQLACAWSHASILMRRDMRYFEFSAVPRVRGQFHQAT
jgi:hypothetical protein